MLRILKTALALTMVLALAACSSLTAPVDESAADQTIQKSELQETEEGSGGTTPPAEEQDDEVSGGGRGRGNQKK